MNQQTKPTRSRAALLDQLYQRINHLDEPTLASLCDLLAEGAQVEFVAEAPPSRRGVGRRAFLTTLLAGGAAAAGSGATLLWQAQGDLPLKSAAGPTLSPTLQGLPLAAQPTSAPPTPGPEATLAGLRDELTSARTEQLTLRAELDGLRRNNDQLVANLQAREADVVYLQQVVALYDQMEAIGLDNTVATGLSPVNLSLAAAATARGLLQVGVQQVAALLSTVEMQAPAIANGLLWLEEQVSLLSGALQRLEDTLSGLVEPVQPVANQIGDFINRVLDILPFGVGDNLQAGLNAVGALLTHIPELVASINPLVITPLRQWVSPEDGQGIVAEVITPINTQLVAPAQQMVCDSAALETTYNEGLKAPVENALATRAAIRADLYRLTGAGS
ncbi:MAG: hypothetical protein JXN59_03410 [Anaerolineae bacterium]|nr:hypothetical protein [Anaerolineae bacterium]